MLSRLKLKCKTSRLCLPPSGCHLHRYGNQDGAQLPDQDPETVCSGKVGSRSHFPSPLHLMNVSKVVTDIRYPVISSLSPPSCTDWLALLPSGVVTRLVSRWLVDMTDWRWITFTLGLVGIAFVFLFAKMDLALSKSLVRAVPSLLQYPLGLFHVPGVPSLRLCECGRIIKKSPALSPSAGR